MSSQKLTYAVSLLLATTAVALTSVDQRGSQAVPARPLASIPGQIEGWTATSDRILEARVEGKLAATDYLDRTYFREGQSIDVFAAYYSVQRPGRAAHSPKNCLPGAGWEISEFGSARANYGDVPVTLNRLRIQNQLDRRLVLYWYQTRRRLLASEYLSKWFLVLDSLRHGDASTAIVRLIVADHTEAEDYAIRFASAIMREVGFCLRAPSVQFAASVP